MGFGILYGIGVGPGDPELITLKGMKILSRCEHIFVPKARLEGDSTALAIASHYVSADSQVHELVFPMVIDQGELSRHWEEAAQSIASVLESGNDACFLTLGDPFLYSTYIYLLRALREKLPGIEVLTVPGITAFSAAAALTEFAVGEGKEWVTIVPAVDDLEVVRDALSRGGTVILMKVGKRLPKVLDLLEAVDVIGDAVFVSRAGQEGQFTETNLGRLRQDKPEGGYLSVLLVHANKDKTGR